MFRHLLSAFLAGIILFAPAVAPATESDAARNLRERLKDLDNNALTYQEETIGVLEGALEHLSTKLKAAQKDLQNDIGLKDNLDVTIANLADVEKTRTKLKADVAEWTADLGTTDLEELRKKIGDALAVARDDDIDTRKLIRIYNLTKKIIAQSSFREPPRSVFDGVKNLDLEYAQTAAALRMIQDRHDTLKGQLDAYQHSTGILPEEIWDREKIKLEMLTLEADALQLRLGIEAEDLAMPAYILMDGILSSAIQLSRFLDTLTFSDKGERALQTSGLDKHGFDWGMPRRMAERYTLKLLILTVDGERLAKEAAEARERVRRDFYKRAAIAFIRALISRQDEIPDCAARWRPVTKAEYSGEEIKVLNCPDPVVENLRAYLGAFKKIQEAETDLLMAEAELLVAEQQIIADFLAAVPLVGEAIDIYSVYAGENLAGVKFSSLERGFVGVAVSIPFVGPQVFRQAMKRSDAFRAKMELFGEFFLSQARLASEISSALRSMSNEATEVFLKAAAKKAGVEVKQLKRMMRFWEETPYVLDDAARQRMKLFKTMRDASEDRVWASTLAGSDQLDELFRRSVKESKTLLRKTVLDIQGVGSAVSHMPAQHKNAFLEVAKRKREAYAFRPVGRDAAELLEKNLAGTKGLNIKPKSSTWGPHKAYIPVEQKFSKLGNPKGGPIDWDKIRTFDAKAKACVANPAKCAKKVPLKVEVPGEALPLEVVIVKKGTDEIPVYRRGSGEILDPDTMKPFRGGEIDASEVRPLHVLADMNGNPLTADYDLLAVGTPRDRNVRSASQGAGFDIHSQQQAARFDPSKGNISEELTEIVDDLNRAARDLKKGGYTRGNLVHHGPDVYNPATEGVFTKTEISDDLSLTIIDPDYGELAIPPCKEDCMRYWCLSSGMCDPDKVCPRGVTTGCIPPDPDRLLKDYFHNARHRGIDFFPHSSWGWGSYNGLGGWTQTSFLKVPPVVAETASGGLRSFLSKGWRETVSSSLLRRISSPSRATLGERGPQ